MNLGEHIQIVEVSPRDGLQNESLILPPQTRAELIGKLYGAGIARVEGVSFVHPARVPAMKGAEEVIALVQKNYPTRALEALTLNQKGFDRALEAQIKTVRYSFSVSETFNQRNQNSSVLASLELGLKLISQAKHAGLRIGVVLSACFGCPFEGEISSSVVLNLAEKLLEAGPHELLFADTIGVGVPKQVRELVGAFSSGSTSTCAIGGHFHNTRNTGYANALAALEAGATVLDASTGGVGGCPFAPNATGNIATDDLVYLLHRMGIPTGIDLDALLEVSQWLEGVLGRVLPAQVYRAGNFPK
jgi:(R)-citramalyl-CoA lyase